MRPRPPTRATSPTGSPTLAGYLGGYSAGNVFVFDYYTVLTGGHHRIVGGAVEHSAGPTNYLAFPTGDSHPSAAGDQVATSEFVPMLNAAYNSWKAGTAVPGMTPVYRFYNKKNGSHFYTASETERNNVLSTLSATYSLDGVAYSVNTSTRPTTHRSTASSTRRTAPTSTRHRWPRRTACRPICPRPTPTTARPTTSALAPPTGSQTVYRFYNKKNGSHFYTASEAERNTVLATLSAVYALDGPAFYVAP